MGHKRGEPFPPHIHTLIITEIKSRLADVRIRGLTDWMSKVGSVCFSDSDYEHIRAAYIPTDTFLDMENLTIIQWEVLMLVQLELTCSV